jgi:hypothetical protein
VGETKRCGSIGKYADRRRLRSKHKVDFFVDKAHHIDQYINLSNFLEVSSA